VLSLTLPLTCRKKHQKYDPLVQMYPTVVKVNAVHNHQYCADAHNQLQITKETKKAFFTYFQNDLSYAQTLRFK